LFETITRINASGHQPRIQQWLIDRAPDLNQTVVVSWSNELAALVKWKLFCDYWDDFCYPVSDDVMIFPLSEEWMLSCLPDENFIFSEWCISGAT
jgi:hypothetical protein